MTRTDLLKFYEKIYFHEAELREKLYVRIQIVFAFYVFIVTSAIYIIRNIDYSGGALAIAALILSVICCIVMAVSIFYLKRAFWGNEFKVISTPEEISRHLENLKEHKVKLEEYNAMYAYNKQKIINPEDGLDNFIFERLQRCSSHNMLINEWRSSQIHQSVYYFFLSLIPLLFSAVVFIGFDLDLSSSQKSKKTEIIVITNSKLI
ncbi:hypothetical protein [Pectobacterium wasabiae]|uniref:SMODS and SLOG-associating 2TM effector domain-containing protein n=1 Tax=Pectobacterium wasabiae TaxID=55208 RepID=A0AAW3EMJ8_9GAMM|nr:hypothetical protein [Pectobacterium wasabiae]AOR65106.1 hypothetical protein A7983_17940 [Pectobacterium wasabiae CFBP 3304]EJS96535.1 Hypothetical protein Y17_0413 [Pectobacterium wasabiae CFBP 3304]KFX09631.1 hypothetical protein JV38_01525 [Pectobacterium wasabiae]KGA29833.1 hypothetical protein KU73_05250 [Pectobacterium wasabiae]